MRSAGPPGPHDGVMVMSHSTPFPPPRVPTDEDFEADRRASPSASDDEYLAAPPTEVVKRMPGHVRNPDDCFENDNLGELDT